VVSTHFDWFLLKRFCLFSGVWKYCCAQTLPSRMTAPIPAPLSSDMECNQLALAFIRVGVWHNFSA
jgi:hypothetical protein